MEYMLPMLLIIFIILLLSVGAQRASQITLGLMLTGILFLFFGWVVINFFWVFLLIWFIKSLTGTKQKKNYNQRKTYYRTYTNKEAEEFFRQFYGQNAGSQGYGSYQNNYDGSYNNQGNGNFNTWGVNKDKYYKDLGVDKNCTKEELRKAYLKKVKEHHPDRFTNSTEEEKKYHEEKLKKINEAYDNLVKDFS